MFFSIAAPYHWGCDILGSQRCWDECCGAVLVSARPKVCLRPIQECGTTSQALPVVVRVDLLKDGLKLELKLTSLIPREVEVSNDARLTITRLVPLQLKRRGVELGGCSVAWETQNEGQILRCFAHCPEDIGGSMNWLPVESLPPPRSQGARVLKRATCAA